MFKKIITLILAISFMAMMPVVTGCDDKDDIKVEKHNTVKDMPVGEPKAKVD